MEQPTGVTIDWAAPDTAPVAAPCRNCGAAGPKPVLLTAEASLPKQPFMRVRLLDCPACGCAFVETVPGYVYDGELADPLAVATYVEAGAGLWPIVRTLARLTLPAGSTYLEIGCGFGFGLDFALRARGWRGRGIDPSPLAVAGRTQLGLPIEARFFGDRPEDTAGQGTGADCIFASEVLEHIDDPRGFLAKLRRGLAAGGALVLTTPNRAHLHRGAPETELVPILSTGAHLVLQTASSLRQSLEQAGFAFVEVEINGAQLVAYASPEPLALEHDPAMLRHAYRCYLDERASALPAGSSLWWGFAGRAYQEAVAESDTAGAAHWWELLRPACQARYGFDLEQPSGLVSQCLTQPMPDLESLAARMPQALPGLLYARALDRLHGGATLAETAALMRAAADAAAMRNTVMLRLGAPDLAASSVQRAALATLAAVAADQADTDCLDAVGVAIAADPDARLSLVRRSFVGLVNAGAFGPAASLRQAWDLGEAGLHAPGADEARSAQERDTLFCLGIVALQGVGMEEAAISDFAAVRLGLDVGGLWWAALRGECVAADRLGRHGHATALLRTAPAEKMPEDLRLRLGEADGGAVQDPQTSAASEDQ